MRQMSLFDDREVYNLLVSRLYPNDLDRFVGQEHLLGKGKLLHQPIEQGEIPSIIFWGPPGMGKTTLAEAIARWVNAQFINFSVITSGIKEIKEVVAQAENSQRMGIKTLLFVDEVHRFNKAQQDAFLPYVEKGSIILIGATTENPFSEVNGALLLRCRALMLQALTEDDLARLIRNAFKSPKELGYLNMEVTNHTIEIIVEFADGDVGTALSTPEMAVTNGVISPDKTTVTEDVLKQCIGKKSLSYDKKEEEHYNLISMLHKSMRNPDPDAAVCWLARMLEAGEDPLYAVRRPVRFTSEGMGIADSRTLMLAVSAYRAYHFLGTPECNVHLSHVVVYLSMAPKSNSAYMAYESTKTDAQNTLAEPVPLAIRNAPIGSTKDLHRGDDYVYAHGTKEKITRMQCLPDSLEGREYYRPAGQDVEEPVKGRLEEIRKWKREK